jgi:hypothetical protein
MASSLSAEEAKTSAPGRWSRSIALLLDGAGLGGKEVHQAAACSRLVVMAA